MRAEAPLGVAVWGLGPHAIRKLLPALVAAPSTRLAGVVTRDAATAAAVAADHGVRAWPTPAAMLADAAVDVVFVATPIGVHHAQGREVLAAGKHLWCEKSLTRTAVEAADLVAAAHDRDLALREAFMYLHHPQLDRLAALVRAPGFGRLRRVSARFGMPHLERPGFRYRRADGGGALLDVGCYPISLAAALLGARLTVASATLAAAPGHEVDTEGEAVLVAADGARAVLEWGYGLAYRNEVLAWGEGGSVHADRVFSKLPGHVATLTVSDARGTAVDETVAAADPFVAMIEAFAAEARTPAGRAAGRDACAAQAHLVGAVAAAAAR